MGPLLLLTYLLMSLGAHFLPSDLAAVVLHIDGQADRLKVSAMATNNAIHTYINGVGGHWVDPLPRFHLRPLGSVLCLLLGYDWPANLFVAACISLDPSSPSIRSIICLHTRQSPIGLIFGDLTEVKS